MSTLQRRPPLPPATGTCRWLNYVDPHTGNRWLHIRVLTAAGPVGEDYEVETLAGGSYRLLRLEPETFEVVTYNLRPWGHGLLVCDCPDSVNRPERRCQCKHARALRAALARLPL